MRVPSYILEVLSSFNNARCGNISATNTMASLKFELEEPFESDLEASYFNLINAFIQPDSQASVQDVANEILDILPQGDPVQETRSKLTSVAAEMASQIPYTHPSMSRLGNLVAHVFNSRKDVQDPPDSSTVGPSSQTEKISLTSRRLESSKHQDTMASEEK